MPETPLLPAVEAVDALPCGTLPAFIAGLGALLARAAGRLAADVTDPQPSGSEGDRLLEAAEVATRTGMSLDWIYRNAPRLPFTRRMGSRTLRFSEAGLVRWLAQQRGR